MKKPVTLAKKRRRHRSAAEWRTLISAHERSGLNQEAFCENEGVSTTSLANWRKRLRIQGDAAPVERTQSPSFIEIGSTIRPLDAGIKVRLELGAGIVLELSRA